MVLAQEHIKQRLQQQMAEGRVPHAQLFCGPEGCGKLAMAIEFAQQLLSQGADERGRRMAELLQHPDLHFVFPVFKPDGQSSNPTSDQFLEQWRAMLERTHYFDLPTWTKAIEKAPAKIKAQRATTDPSQGAGKEDKSGVKKLQIYTEESESILRKLSLVSSQGGYKVMIVWLPELMHQACSNKILKILEEPPQQTVFILVSNHPEQLLDTIVSRCQRVEFKALPEPVIAEALVRERGLDEDTARFVAHSAAGSYTRALQHLVTNETDIKFFNLFIMFMRTCYSANMLELRKWSEQVAAMGREQQKNFLDYCQRLLRENFIYNFHNPELNFMTQEESNFSVKFARFINERNIIGFMEELSSVQRDIEQNANAKIVFFDFGLKAAVLLRQ